MPRPLPKFEYPEFPFKEIPPVMIHLRGTSSQYSKPGTARAMIGKAALSSNQASEAMDFLEAYYIPPRASSHEAWRERAEATFHAAVERALDHSLMVGAGGVDNLLKPAHLPVLVFGVEPNYIIGPFAVKPSISLSGDVEHYREHYEEALVNGKLRRTFIEGRMPFPGMHSDTHYFRVALTRQEYHKILREAMERAKQAGHDLKGGITIYTQKIDELARQFNEAVGGEKQESRWPPAVKEIQAAMDRLHEETGWDLVKDTIGHEKIEQWDVPKETGQHASHAYTYYIGEHVKQALLAKAYARLQREIPRAWKKFGKKVYIES